MYSMPGFLWCTMSRRRFGQVSCLSNQLILQLRPETVMNVGSRGPSTRFTSVRLEPVPAPSPGTNQASV